ncbi:hypothetical protein B0H11DRAFT_1932185 [Mycena galericulata]|nr:hypothetical protein B0H11DRAFT_1932185 [Mycena galericulata]
MTPQHFLSGYPKGNIRPYEPSAIGCALQESSPGSRRKSGRSVLRSKSTPAPSPPAASPSASISADEMYHREDSPPIEPPELEDSRLYYFARAGVVMSPPPNTPPPPVEAYPTAAPTHHRELPQINMAVSVAVPSSPEVYWQPQQSQHSNGVSPVSDTYGSGRAVSVPAYQLPLVVNVWISWVVIWLWLCMLIGTCARELVLAHRKSQE